MNNKSKIIALSLFALAIIVFNFISNTIIENAQTKTMEVSKTPNASTVILDKNSSIEYKMIKEITEPEKEPEPEIEIVEVEVPDKSSMTFLLDNGNPYTISSEDLVLLGKAVEAEAEGLSNISKAMVCDVIINRVKSEDFPNTIKDVIYENGQFEVVSNGRIDRVVVTSTTKKAVRMGIQFSLTRNSLFFCNMKLISDRNTNYFNSLDFVMKDVDGHHSFFKY